jgi:hypothetical protein
MWIYRRISLWSACKFWKVAKDLLHYEICMPEIHFSYIHGCQMFLKIQNSGAIALPQKEKIGYHMYQIIQREPPEEQGFDARLYLSKKSIDATFSFIHIFWLPPSIPFLKSSKNTVHQLSPNVCYPLMLNLEIMCPTLITFRCRLNSVSKYG